jgi:hypothetical protein
MAKKVWNERQANVYKRLEDWKVHGKILEGKVDEILEIKADEE